MAAPQTHSWPTVSLAWRQLLAAFWLLAWPSWLISVALFMVLTLGWTVVGLKAHAEFLSWAGAISFLLCQRPLVRRMLRKSYRSFRLEVVRADAPETATLTRAEVAHIWLKIVWPQVGFLVAVWFIQLWFGSRLTPDMTKVIPTLSLWLRILVVGPFGIYCAVKSEYPTFRLEAVGERFV